VLDLAMPDARWLQHTIAGLDSFDAFAFVFESGPAFEHVIHLEFAVVNMPLASRLMPLFSPDDVRDDFALGGFFYAKIPVLEITA
jgi:hypothetical protein